MCLVCSNKWTLGNEKRKGEQQRRVGQVHRVSFSVAMMSGNQWEKKRSAESVHSVLWDKVLTQKMREDRQRFVLSY